MSSTRRAPTFAAASERVDSASEYTSNSVCENRLTAREGVVVVVQQLLGVERLETLQDTVADAARAERADDFAFEVERVARDVRHPPLATLDHLMRGHEVAHEEEDVHDDVLRDGDDVGACNLQDLDVPLDGGIEVDVVGPNTGGDTDLEVLGLGDELASEVARVEGRGDEDLGVLDVLLEDAVRAFLVIGDLAEEQSLVHYVP